MDGTAVVVYTLVGAAAGFIAPKVADAIATPRYGPASEDHDPEDTALAPMSAPSSERLRIVTAVLGALSFMQLASVMPVGDLAAVFAGLAWVCIVASIVDLQYLRLPNVLTYGGAAAALVAIIAASTHLDVTESIRGAVIGAFAFAGFLFVFAEVFRMIRGKSGMGLGDVKLALSLGATVGWLGFIFAPGDAQTLGTIQLVVYAALFGNLLGTIGGLALTRFRPGRSFPFGPFLALGWLITALAYDSLIISS